LKYENTKVLKVSFEYSSVESLHEKVPFEKKSIHAPQDV